MKAAVYYSNTDIRVEDVPKPEAGPGELLVRIMASGLCGSDVMEWYRIKKAPIILGHEITGTVEEAGSGVMCFKVGDRVTVAHHIPCNTCKFCLAGNHSVCDTLRTTNFDPGGFCEFVRVPAINVDRGVFKLPKSMTFEDGSFSEPLGCVLRGMRKSGFKPGMSVLVIGSGISGILHIKLARALGAGRIIASDINSLRLDAAIKAGADLAVPATEDVTEAVKNALGGAKADFVVICAGADTAIKTALKSVERAGTLIFFAPKEPGETYPMPLFDLWRDNITIVNSYASCPEDTLTALSLIETGRVKVRDMISHRLSLDETAKGFKLVSEAAGSMKVIIEPGREGSMDG